MRAQAANYSTLFHGALLAAMALGGLGSLERASGQSGRKSRSGCLTELMINGIQLGPEESPLKTINEQLCRELQDDTPAANAQLLVQWAEREAAAPGKRRWFLLRKSRERHEALAQLAANEQLRAAGDLCATEGARNLRANAASVGRHLAELRAQTPRGPLACNRVFGVFFAQIVAHLTECPAHYGHRLLADLVPALDSDQLKLGAESLFELEHSYLTSGDGPATNLTQLRAVRDKLAGSAGHSGEQSAESRAPHQEEEFIEASAASLARVIRFDAAQLEPAEAETHAYTLVNDFLFKPCAYLTGRLEPVLGPASLDLANLDRYWPAAGEWPEAERQLADYEGAFYELWARYLTCDKLLDANYTKLGLAFARKLTHPLGHTE